MPFTSWQVTVFADVAVPVADVIGRRRRSVFVVSRPKIALFAQSSRTSTEMPLVTTFDAAAHSKSRAFSTAADACQKPDVAAARRVTFQKWCLRGWRRLAVGRRRAGCCSSAR